VDTGETTIKDVEFNFIELLKFNKTIDELENLTDKWIYFIKNAENLDVIPENVDDKGLLSAYQEANQHTWSQEELDAYDYVDMREEDGRAQMDLAIKKALAKAQKEADDKALKEKDEAILVLFNNGVPIPIIAQSFNKTEEEITEIIEKYRR
jgi:predicted transposase/invertase (TIGR01784 family)